MTLLSRPLKHDPVMRASSRPALHQVNLSSKPRQGQEGRDLVTAGYAPTFRLTLDEAERGVWDRADGTAPAFATARLGVSGVGSALPHLETIQESFGCYDVSNVRAYTDRAAVVAARKVGAEAFTWGECIVFAGKPGLRDASHEAAHVIQQRTGVLLHGGVGRVADDYERHADAVADCVVRGRSAATLLDPLFVAPSASSHGGSTPSIQFLVKDNFPWSGIVVDTWSAALRSSPRRDFTNPHAGIVADLPRGTPLRVVGRSGARLKVTFGAPAW